MKKLFVCALLFGLLASVPAFAQKTYVNGIDSNYPPFAYVDKGSMATIGRNRAVCDLKFSYLYGRPAWATWMFIHLISILGMRNKVNVMVNWIWAYLFYSTSLRLLIRPVKYPIRKHWIDE